MGDKKLTTKMINYSNVREAATIAYVSPKGEVKSVFIHRSTFDQLMSGGLDKTDVPGMTPSLDQSELRDVLRREIGKDYMKWFDKTANDLLRQEANASSEAAG